jgi:2-oxo-3-hexenedioate decarboxylase/2-keto-4-pentenoate hydratase
VTLSAEACERAAQTLCEVRLRRGPVSPLPLELRPPDEAAAYRVQDALHRRLAASGHGEVVGHKIGCTTPVMREALGIFQPKAGGVFASTVHRDAAIVRHADYVRPAVESEIAVRLAADLPADGAPYTRASVAAAVGACMAAIELTDDRCDPTVVDVPTQLADDFFNTGCVLGRPDEAFDATRLDEVRVRLDVNGTQIGAGDGAMVMGHPLEALAWLANELAGRGRMLRAGEFVLLGSVVKGFYVDAGDDAVVTFEPFGAVRVRYAA